MKQSKLILLLSSLAEHEFRQLPAFLDKQREKVTTANRLFQILGRHYPGFKEAVLSKEKIFSQLFPGSAYSEIRLMKVMSELTGQVESYIVAMGKNKNTIEDGLVLLKYYHERNLDKYFDSAAREIREQLKKLPESSHKNIYLYRFSELLATYKLKFNNRHADYQQVYGALIEMCEAEQLRWKNLSLINLFPELEYELPSGIYFRLHKQLNELLVHKNDDDFISALEAIEDNIHKFEKEESRELLKIILDYSIQQVNHGVKPYYEYLLRIYKLFIARDLVLNDHGTISISTYKNFITVALKLSKPKEAMSFLENYKSSLQEDVREDVYTFNKANILFEQENYGEVIDLLQAAHFTDIFYKINRKRLLIKTYSELLLRDDSYFSLLESQVNAFYKFIYIEKKIPDVYINANKNFIKFIKKLVGGPVNKESRSKLLQKIRSTRQLAEREWLEDFLVRMK